MIRYRAVYTQKSLSRMEIHIIEKQGVENVCPFSSFIRGLLMNVFMKNIYQSSDNLGYLISMLTAVFAFTAQRSSSYYLRTVNQKLNKAKTET